MTREEFEKELSDDKDLRKAVKRFNRAYAKHYGPPRPVWPRVAIWAVLAALIVAIILLAIPAFAQDTERPDDPGPPKMRGTRRLSDEEKQRILREADLPPLPSTAEEKKQTQQEWERQKAAWGDKPISIPLSDQEAREWMGWKEKKPGMLEIASGIVFVVFTLLIPVAYIKHRRDKKK